MLSDSLIVAADRGAGVGRCSPRSPGAPSPALREADWTSAAPPWPQILAMLGVGGAASPARGSSGEPEREPGRGSFGSAPNDLLPGTPLALAPPATAASALVMGGGKRRVSHSPPRRAAAAGGDEARCSADGDVCRGARVG